MMWQDVSKLDIYSDAGTVIRKILKEHMGSDETDREKESSCDDCVYHMVQDYEILHTSLPQPVLGWKDFTSLWLCSHFLGPLTSVHTDICVISDNKIKQNILVSQAFPFILPSAFYTLKIISSYWWFII